MLKILKSKCQGVLVVGWPESPSAESNRGADSAGRIGVSDVSNRPGDITTQSEQPSASGPIDGSWGLNKDQGGFPLNRQKRCQAHFQSDTLPLNDFMSHKGPT